jgi:hypothetical protein
MDAPSTSTLCASVEEQEAAAAAAAGDASHVWDSLVSLPPSLTTTSIIHAAPSQPHDHNQRGACEVVVLEGLQSGALGDVVDHALSREALSRAEVHKHAYDLLNGWADGGAASAVDFRREKEEAAAAAAATVAAAEAELLSAAAEREQEAAAAAAAAQEEARRRKHEQLEQAQEQLEAEERRLHAELQQAQEQKEVRLRARACASCPARCAFRRRTR